MWNIFEYGYVTSTCTPEYMYQFLVYMYICMYMYMHMYMFMHMIAHAPVHYGTCKNIDFRRNGEIKTEVKKMYIVFYILYIYITLAHAVLV